MFILKQSILVVYTDGDYMIFVTVGTHEQPFNRLIKAMDECCNNYEIIREGVVMQIGYSEYEPQNCIWKRFFSHTEIEKLMKESRIIVTHGGPSSFMAAKLIGKVPIVVPRQHKLGEHVNDHQVEFVQSVSRYLGGIITLYKIENLGKTIQCYESLSKLESHTYRSNNTRFCVCLEELVSKI